MTLLSTFTYAGLHCLANGLNCLAHGLPTTPDWASGISRSAGAASASSIPIDLVTRGTTIIAYYNGNPGMSSEAYAQYVHSIGR